MDTPRVAVDLANTLESRRGELVDTLATPADARAWLRAHTGAGARRDEDPLAELRSLRDAIRELLAAVTEHRRPRGAAVRTVNGASESAPSHLVLGWASGPTVRRARMPRTGTATAWRAELADGAIAFIGGTESGLLRACGARDCVQFFVKDHPRREWCSPACGNRVRNARFHQRARQTPLPRWIDCTTSRR